MAKLSVPITNDFCPQTMFLYGTYKEDGTPNFGLFSWISYCWDKELGFIASIGGAKLTRDRINANKIFSANLVSGAMLPLADYFGNHEGYKGDKLPPEVAVEKGKVLNVPVLTESPVVFELEVFRAISLDDGEVFLCRIRNVQCEESLVDDTVSIGERIRSIAPPHWTCDSYFTWDGAYIGPYNTLYQDKYR